MRRLAFLWLLVVFNSLPCAMAKTSQPASGVAVGLPSASSGAGGLPSSIIEIVPKTIALDAIKLVRSRDKAKHERARALLTDEEFLLKLNIADEYLRFPTENLQLHFILEALTKNPHKLAMETVDVLASNPRYMESGPRLTSLLVSTRNLASSTAKIQQFWKEQLKPDADELNLTVNILVENGSAAAIRIFEEALLANKFEQDYVVAWLQNAVLRHRQNARVLEACQRLLKSEKWPDELKSALVEVLFDYRPSAWYQQEIEPPKPPRRDKLGATSRKLLREIADLALSQRRITQEDRIRIDADLKSTES